MNIQLIVVDPQNDFCVADDGKGHKGTLVVPNAEADMLRVADMIRRVGPKLTDIHVTLDSHQTVGIERPRWWVRVSDRSHVAPFTILGIHPDGKRIVKFTADATGLHPTEEEYTTYKPSFLHKGGPTGEGTFGYLKALAAKKRYPHVVWTEHCVVGTWGWSIVEGLAGALRDWEWNEFGRVNYVTKGNNPWTEHFSGVQAEVPDPSDPSTQVNTGLVTTLAEADLLLFAGEARSHCDANTGRDIIANFPDPSYAKKMVFLTDAMSDVPGFEFMGDAFVQEMKAAGAQFATTTDILA